MVMQNSTGHRAEPSRPHRTSDLTLGISSWVETEQHGRPDAETEKAPERHQGMGVEVGRSGWET